MINEGDQNGSGGTVLMPSSAGHDVIVCDEQGTVGHEPTMTDSTLQKVFIVHSSHDDSEVTDSIPRIAISTRDDIDLKHSHVELSHCTTNIVC